MSSQYEVESKYLESNLVFIYPSSNATDGGQNNSEINVEDLNHINHYGKNYVVRRFNSKLPDDPDDPTPHENLFIEYRNNQVILHPCIVSIQGYFIRITEDKSFAISSDFFDPFPVDHKGNRHAYIHLSLIKDGSNNVRGDVRIRVDSEYKYICDGIRFVYARTPITDDEDYLYLADLRKSSKNKITCTINPNVFTTIDVYNIYDNTKNQPLYNSLIVINDAIENLNGHFIHNSTSMSSGLQTIGTDLNIINGSFRVLNGDTSLSSSNQMNRVTIDNLSIGVRSNQVNFTGDNGALVDIINNTGSNNYGDAYVNVHGTVVAERVYNAVWNDYAEYFLKNNSEIDYEPGTVICKVRGSDAYAESTFSSRRLVVGVCSDSYGHILGGENLMNMEDNKKKYIPVAISGRVRVKVKKGDPISEGDLLYVSDEDGKATSRKFFENEEGCVIGKALEDSDGSKEKVLMMVMLK